MASEITPLSYSTTSHSLGNLRRRALEIISAAAPPDSSVVLAMVYGHEGRRIAADVEVGGRAADAWAVDSLDGSPIPTGHPCDDATGVRWRKQLWTPCFPLPRQYNQFVEMDAIAETEDWKETAWRRDHCRKAAVSDQRIALIYGEKTLLGWAGVFLHDQPRRFSVRQCDDLNRAAVQTSPLLELARAQLPDRSARQTRTAVADTSGEIQCVSEDFSQLPDEHQRLLDRLLKTMKQDSCSTSRLAAIADGLKLSVERLRGAEQDQFLVQLAPARTYGVSPLHHLTNAQRQVSSYAAAGATYREIAEVLEVSPNTVKFHLRQIYETLGIGSRAELATIWQEQGRPYLADR